MTPLTLSALAILLSGCAAVDRFWDKEIVAVYAPDHLHEQEKTYLIEAYNYWLGQPKKDRVRALGAPSQCTALNTGGELCEWMHSGSAAQQHVTFTYDRDGIARAWSSQGVYGQLTSADAPAARVPLPSAPPPLSP